MVKGGINFVSLACKNDSLIVNFLQLRKQGKKLAPMEQSKQVIFTITKFFINSTFHHQSLHQ